LIAAPYDGRALGPAINHLRRPMAETALWGMPIMAGRDLAAFLSAMRDWRSFAHVAGRLVRHARDMLRHGRAMQLVNGSALVARLMASAMRVGVQWRLNTPALALGRDGEGVVRHVIIADGAGRRVLRARRAVVLATGGFPQNAALRAEYFGYAGAGAHHYSVAVGEADGAGLAMAQGVGGVLDRGVCAAGAWCPVSIVPYAGGRTGHFPHIIERAKAGIIAVRADGRRFVNEANGYHDYVAALLAATPAGDVAQSWLICDHRFQREFGLGITRPFPFSTRRWRANGYLRRAPTLDALAQICGIDAAGLAGTIARYNADAAAGVDGEYGRGSTPYNRVQGDARCAPNPNVRPMGAGPYYAVRVVPGSFGTFAGLATDGDARALDQHGAPIPGLYVAGNDMASVMGGHYPAGGINLGPAMTFGYIAARHILAHPAPANPANPATARNARPAYSAHNARSL
ncbi:MAG: FAD-binding protein, partial [Sphingopyxis sp.]